MKIRAKFPLPFRTHGLPGAKRNSKVIREAVLLDTYGNDFESAVVTAAELAKTHDQEIFVSRSYGPAGRFSVWIVDQGSGDRLQRRKDLAAALGRVAV